MPPSNESDKVQQLEGRLLSLDLGTRRIGVAVSDELRLTVRPLPHITRTNWKQLVRMLSELLGNFDAQGIVIGLPIKMDGTEGPAALEARRIARNLELTLRVPVFLQDERLTSFEAKQNLSPSGVAATQVTGRLDSEAAALILRDFISSL